MCAAGSQYYIKLKIKNKIPQPSASRGEAILDHDPRLQRGRAAAVHVISHNFEPDRLVKGHGVHRGDHAQLVTPTLENASLHFLHQKPPNATAMNGGVHVKSHHAHLAFFGENGRIT